MLEGMDSLSRPSRSRRPQSTQTLLVAGGIEALSIVALLLAFLINVGSPATVLATFLGFMALSVITSSLAFIMALVGLLRFKRHTGGFAGILALSLLANPVLWLFLVGSLA